MQVRVSLKVCDLSEHWLPTLRERVMKLLRWECKVKRVQCAGARSGRRANRDATGSDGSTLFE
eukprot:352173-Pleurochrysis_carterae.AAC.1